MAKRYQLPQEAVFPIYLSGNDESNLGWAACGSSILWQSGWADDSVVYGAEQKDDGTTTDLVFNSASDVFGYYKICFTNDSGNAYFGANWFFSGNYPLSFIVSQNKVAGGSFKVGQDFGDYAYWIPSFNTEQLGKIWPEVANSGTEEEPSKIPNYGGVVGGLYVANASSSNIEDSANIVAKREVVVIGYETGGDHSAAFDIVETAQNDAGSFPVANASNPRYVTGFCLIDPNDEPTEKPVLDSNGNPVKDDEGNVETETVPPAPFWVFAKYYPDLRAFRLKPEQPKESWNGSEYYLTSFFYLVKNPEGKGFINQDNTAS